MPVCQTQNTPSVQVMQLAQSYHTTLPYLGDMLFLCHLLLFHFAFLMVHKGASVASSETGGAGREGEKATHQVDGAADIAVHEDHQAVHQVTRREGRPLRRLC